ncbi:MAG: bifunctional 4-hydroxy-3-methylbut-2-enyl diphosphate reductase/30S ribosomal protein S1 [Acutalibacteraceae bacterium]|nr:bifunctional 4-hydroxy-3-methylbut-2-enyl diphosphate reductase/30S ribosomal protein S1 [Acutalibacteraceae bacterium]
MKITKAETAGFCFGVNRAVNMVYELLEEGKKVCTLGPIIHNPQLVAELEGRGVRIVSSPEEVKEGETLVIRSHGVEKAVYDKAYNLGVDVADATCPFVAKIHKIVAENSAKGAVTIIAGDKDHQEVKGIIGHCVGEYFVVASEEELDVVLENEKKISENDLILVSQTTFNAQIWGKLQKKLKKLYTNAKIFDTICNATSLRQSEADKLSKLSDAIVVIGGRHSSNTAKLHSVCKPNCDKTYLIETASELCFDDLKDCHNIGVVAGASTPAGIIKEVIDTMMENLQPTEEQVEETAAQKTFEEMTDEEAFEASLSGLTGDQKVEGIVVAVNPTEITVDIGRGVTGYISAAEYSSDPDVKLTDEVKVDDKLNLIIMKINDQEGTAMLSKRRFDAIAGWDKIVEAKESGEVLTGYVKDIIKGGVVAYTNNIRVFIPASQATASRNDSLEDLKGKEVSFRIIEIGRGRRAVGSIRSVLRDERKAAAQAIWDNIEVGDRFTGTVKSLTNYGAFVDIGGVDGMVHVSELSWTRIKNPSEVVLVGDTVEVYVKAIDKEKKKISLGYKKEEENPWVIFQKNYDVNDVVKVTIVSMTTYGAFARIIPGIDGLIHISQIADKHIAKPQDELTVGQEVEAKIIAVDNDKKRVSLSIRALIQKEEEEKQDIEANDEVVYEATEDNAPVPEAEVIEAAAEVTEAEVEVATEE